MPQAQTPYHTSDDEVVLTKRDLRVASSFAGYAYRDCAH